jgi:putative flavoprotein involved in K+ transport
MEESMPEAEILVIGGGPAGLTSAGALKHAGLEATILDASEHVGQSWEQRYERLHLHTVRNFSGLAHFPIPRSYPKYLSKDQYAGYLRDYAAHFDLHVVHKTRAKRIRQVNINNDGRAGWAVDTDTDTWHARVVIIATGQFGQPKCPEWPGMTQFAGQIIHSSQYRTGQVFQGQRVLVIGSGNSGMEMAADLAEQGAARVAISIRSAPPVVPRDFLGTPAQVFAIVLSAFPPVIGDSIGKVASRVKFGDLTRFDLPAPKWLTFAAQRTPVIDVGFVKALQAGKVRIRPKVQSFTSGGVTFEDGQEEPFDAVILATGYHTGLASLLEPEGLLNQDGSPIFPSATTTPYPGLFFMCHFPPLRGFLYEANLGSQRLAREIKR